MKFFQKLMQRLRKPGHTKQDIQPINQDGDLEPAERLICAHGKPPQKIEVTVLGFKCEFHDSPMCATCTQQYLNKFSTLCAWCKRPIFPGTPVGQAWHGAPHPFTHLTLKCCDSGGFYCGRWDEGRLISLHELNPEKYPAGTPSVLAHAFKSGEVVIENVED